jgi:type IV pilus assembly protein PilB
VQNQSGNNNRIGQLLVSEGVIDERQLEQALTEQAQRGVYRPLGEILRELGFVSRGALHDVLLKYRKQILLGELLLKMGVISDARLAQALKAQQQTGKKLGQILVDWGFVTRARLVDALCVQLGVSGVDPGACPPDQDLLDKVSSAFLRRKGVMPLKYDEDHRAVTVLMEDPADSETITDLRKIFKTDIVPVMLRTDSVGHLIDELFDIWHSSR